jgi:mono/diheme cytochrome c family protein
MRRSAKRFLFVSALVTTAVSVTACASFGTQRIGVPKSKGALYQGAVLFNQRCSGCHTLSYAAARGSAVNVRTAQYNNGPNFDQRCERPVTRVLYAITNGGFSGAIMPQNVVVGQQAIDVAEFVATYAGRQAPKIPGQTPCEQKPIGTLANLAQQAAAAGTPAGPPASSPVSGSRAAARATSHAAAKKRAATAPATSKHKP